MNTLTHCVLCEHQKLDLATGTTCGITNKKPDFFKTCPKIEFDEKLDSKIKRVHIELKTAQNEKLKVYFHLFFFFILGVLTLLGGYYLGSRSFSNGVISTVPLIVMGIGIFLFIVGISPLYKYYQKLNVLIANKNDLDTVIDVYGIQYDIDISFGQEIHGKKEVFSNLKVHKKP